MRWPWGRREKRAADYGDEVARLLLARAQPGALADHLHTLALEAAAGTVGRAFAAATVTGGIGPELEPHLEMIGRSFIRRGECLLVPRRGGYFSPASSWNAKGSGGPWQYEATIAEPDAQNTLATAGSRVLHFRAQTSRDAPWRGRGPLEVADSGALLISNLEAALANETGGPHGQVVPVPTNPDEDALGDLKAAIKDLAGRVLVAESQRRNWNDAEAGGARSDDWRPQRLGANPPDGLVKLFVEHRRAVLVACGVPPELLGGGEGTAGREGWRRFLHGTLAPYGYILEREARDKGFGRIRLGWDRLRASDLTGRARAYQSLVGAGMDTGRASRLPGFEG
ncbi:hypothetical protein [Candidatus Palauibacter sp.]|uniref:hypothetical protein n=1 Tax=Candidatus Palauibacter sp. TaxID=3101350 RepID=UPI003AF2D7DA